MDICMLVAIGDRLVRIEIIILFNVLNVNPYFDPHFHLHYQSLFSQPKMVHINFPVYANEASNPCLFYVF